MAIGTTETLNPDTGERVSTQFNYTPVDPQQDMMRQAFEQSQQAFYPPPPQPQGPTPYWENPETYYPQRQRGPDPVAQAKAATAAAYKYIAFRGYQQDLKDGKSAADAFAKWGPMLVQDVSLAPTIKALAPTPQWTYNKQTRAYEGGGRPIFNPHAEVAAAPTFVPANPTTGEPAHYLSGGKAQFIPQGAASHIDPFVKNDYDREGDRFERASKIYGNEGESEETRKEAIKVMADAQAKMDMIRRNAGKPSPVEAKPVAPVAAINTTKTLPKVGEVRKGYTFKGGNPALAENWIKLTQ